MLTGKLTAKDEDDVLPQGWLTSPPSHVNILQNDDFIKKLRVLYFN